MVPRAFIEEPSQECASTGPKKKWESESYRARGARAEQRTAEYFESQGFEVIAKNLKTPFAEVDLLLKNHLSYWLVEVKTAPHLNYEAARLSRVQKQRLVRAYHYLSRRHSPLRTILAWVYPTGEVRSHYDFLTS